MGLKGSQEGARRGREIGLGCGPRRSLFSLPASAKSAPHDPSNLPREGQGRAKDGQGLAKTSKSGIQRGPHMLRDAASRCPMLPGEWCGACGCLRRACCCPEGATTASHEWAMAGLTGAGIARFTPSCPLSPRPRLPPPPSPTATGTLISS